MNLHWMKDRILQKEFWIYRDKGDKNRGNYFTKHYPPRRHKLIRPKYILGYKTTSLCLSTQLLVRRRIACARSAHA